MSGKYSNDGSHLVVPDDPLQTLINCEGCYVCPVSADGSLKGPIVGYTGTYDDGGVKRHYVGLTYFNFSAADQWPSVLSLFAEEMLSNLMSCSMDPTVILGAPWAGIKFSQEVAQLFGCRHIFAEKGEKGLFLGRYDGAIRENDAVVIGEELVNNLSTTEELCRIVEGAGARVVGIVSAINRSYPFRNQFIFDGSSIPILAVIERETPQYQQDDPVVAASVAEGNVVWKPKYGWSKLRDAMSRADIQ